MKIKTNILTFSLCFLILLIPSKKQKDTLSYMNKNLTIEERVENLLKQMTLEEKIELLGGTDPMDTKAIKRLGIPPIKMSDGPLGVRWEKSTALPVSISLAATWDTNLVSQYATVLANETKAHERDMLLGPCININRVPMGGRNFESYGEDPFLTSRIAVSYIKTLQNKKVIPSVKHFAVNNQEHNRMTVSAEVDERTLREIYLPAFEAAVKEANVWTVMAAYNKLNGYYCTENNHLQNEILKKDWDFKGFIVSDWGATHSVVECANNGLDLEMPYGEYFGPKLLEAVKEGKVSESTIDDKVRRILTVMFEAGLFDNKKVQGSLNTKEHQQIALNIAKEGIVLLKNENNILPINKNKISSIAVIGPNAAVCRTGGGGSSQVNPFYSVSPLEALKKKIGNKVKINYAVGCILQGDDVKPIESSNLYTIYNGKKVNGLLGEYFNNMNLEGNPDLVRVDKQIDFDFGSYSPSDKINNDRYSARWTGKLVASKTDKYEIITVSDDGVRLYIDNKLVIDNWTDHAPYSNTIQLELEANKEYDIKLEYYENGGGAVIKLGWSNPREEEFTEAIQSAKNSDIVLFFGGLSNNYESEGFDRPDMKLPQNQIDLINEISKVNKNIVVILNTGAQIEMNDWFNNANGIVEAWYPGQEGGNAIAEVLLGEHNPSGKLPITFPKRWEDSPAYGNYPGNESVKYAEGIFVGYRYFDTKKVEPLFPFGFGLSYTTFDFSDIKIEPLNKSNYEIKVTCKVKNSGNKEGSEVVQLYVKDLVSSVERPDKELKGFAKVNLKPNETKEVSFTLNKRSFAFYDVNKKDWIVEPGEFDILIGSSSKDIKLKEKITF